MARYRKSYSYDLFDKVEGAFRALRRQGLLAYLPNDLGESSCCSGCATSVIASDLEDDPDQKGYVFYHDQDRESGQESGKLCIRYGSRPEGSEADSVAIGNLVAEALRKQGLVVDWDGNPNRVISVTMSY
jgi:hypothetical protein